MRISFLLLLLSILPGCTTDLKEPMISAPESMTEIVRPILSLERANHLASLPLKCIEQEYPNKLGQTLSSASDLAGPQQLHPAFFGCFDWHSSVHGHWMLVALLKRFPNLDQATAIRTLLQKNLNAANIAQEVAYFEGKGNKSFERTYGWAWYLKLAEELYTWDDPMAKTLYTLVDPLVKLIRDRYIEFLPKLIYPIRVGEHTNTGFGISFAWDFANQIGDKELLELINNRATDWYIEDENCPLSWEPSGYDFLSPCLEEADIMRRVLSTDKFNDWLKKFLPQLYEPDFNWAPGKVSDRSDGKLVHLDGLNFSRAWVLYGLANAGAGNKYTLERIAQQQIEYSITNIVDGDYAGEHWLASFAVYALIQAADENE